MKRVFHAWPGSSARRARAVLRDSVLVDVEWISAQVGRTLSRSAAVDAYAADPDAISPHPLFDGDWVAEVAALPAGQNPLVAWLADPRLRRRAPHPLIDLGAVRRTYAEKPTTPQGVFVHWLERIEPDTVLPTHEWFPEITYDQLRAASFAGLAAHRSGAGTARTAPQPDVSIVLPIERADRIGTLRWSRAASTPGGVEVVVAGQDLRPTYRVLLEVLATRLDLSVVPVPERGTTAHLASVGAAASAGPVLVLADPASAMTRPDLDRLVEALADESVSLAVPLLVDPLEAVVSAGGGFADEFGPFALLRGHAISDALALGPHPVPAPYGDVVATASTTLAEQDGLDARFDLRHATTVLGLRAPGSTVLVPEALAVRRHGQLPLDDHLLVDGRRIVDEHPDLDRSISQTAEVLRDAGFEVDHPSPAPRLRTIEVSESAPALRWVIDLASPPIPEGERWGDLHFGRSLADALRRLGQRVAVDNARLRDRPTRDLDDVVLVLRGLDRVTPRPGQLSLLWVISHPDLVEAAEAAEFDAVYAAGAEWAGRVSHTWGIPVAPLLQCTDPAVFHPGLAEPDTGPELLFVGNSRGIYRTSVRAAVEAGLDLTLFGRGWREFLPADAVTGAFVPNGEVGVLYGSAGITLNDHWEDMRRDGFLSNRLFDAAASGARIVTDRIAGVEEVFGAQVQVFDDAADLRRVVEGRDVLFPGVEERRALARRVVAEHSFDARARVLLDDAVRLWADRRPR